MKLFFSHNLFACKCLLLFSGACSQLSNLVWLEKISTYTLAADSLSRVCRFPFLDNLGLLAYLGGWYDLLLFFCSCFSCGFLSSYACVLITSSSYSRISYSPSYLGTYGAKNCCHFVYHPVFVAIHSHMYGLRLVVSSTLNIVSH